MSRIYKKSNFAGTNASTGIAFGGGGGGGGGGGTGYSQMHDALRDAGVRLDGTPTNAQKEPSFKEKVTDGIKNTLIQADDRLVKDTAGVGGKVFGGASGAIIAGPGGKVIGAEAGERLASEAAGNFYDNSAVDNTIDIAIEDGVDVVVDSISSSIDSVRGRGATGYKAPVSRETIAEGFMSYAEQYR